MADPLSLLRQFNVNRREIVEKGEWICFGEYCWPKTVNTNYLEWGSSKDGPEKKYYTLESLYFFIRNSEKSHPAYVREAANANIYPVRRPDRKELLAYLSGETNTNPSIDKSAPIELPVPLADVLKSLGEANADHSSVVPGTSSVAAAGDEGPTAAKVAKLVTDHEIQKAKEKFSEQLDSRGITRKQLTAAGTTTSAEDGSSIHAALTSEKIAALKAKRLAKKRNTIIDAESDIVKEDSEETAGGPSILYEFDSRQTREIQSRERIWRNRTTILQSTGKNFAKTIFPILQSVKMREEGGAGAIKKPTGTLPPPPVLSTPTVPSVLGSNRINAGPPGIPPIPTPVASLQQQQYNRYDQERFSRNEAGGFRIDTTGTYSGLPLKSITEGGALPQPQTPAPSRSSLGPSPGSTPGSAPGSGQLKKRTSKTPIIIIPSTHTSLITMSNAKSILEDIKYIDSSAGGEKPSDLLIQRKKADGSTIPYRIIDNPHKLNLEDWDRVVAVFVQGPAWQFKGWPWHGNPVEIFARIKAFHLKFDESKLDANVAKWSVEVIDLSRHKRHLDRAHLLHLWNSLDNFMMKNKPHLRF